MLNTLRFIWKHPLASRHRLAAVGRFVRWQFASRMAPGPILCNWVGSARFIASRGETGLTGNVYTGLHEFEDMAFVLHLLRPGDLFADVGANVGSYTLLACGVAGAEGVAFEPVPHTYRRLLDNIRINGLESRVSCRNAGVAATKGRIRFTTDQNAMNHAVADTESAANAIEIETEPLDSAFGGRVPRLIKIDVEGYEAQVIEGAARTLSDNRLQALIIELNGSGNRYGVSDKDILERMRSHGFEPYAYMPFARRLQRLADVTCDGNLIFVRDLPAVESQLANAPHFVIHGVRV